MVSRKAHDSQLIGIRAALRGGASWEQIAEALAVPADSAGDAPPRASPSDWTPQPQPATWPARGPSADRPYRAAYDAAQDRAATRIIGWLVEHATTRVGPRGAQLQVPVEVLEAVTVRHHTSHAGDPHR